MPKAISFSLGLKFIYLKEYLLLRNKALKMQVSIEGTDRSSRTVRVPIKIHPAILVALICQYHLINIISSPPPALFSWVG